MEVRGEGKRRVSPQGFEHPEGGAVGTSGKDGGSQRLAELPLNGRQTVFWDTYPQKLTQRSPGSSHGKESAWRAGHPSSIPGSSRSPREQKGNPLQYFYLKNPMDRGAWWATGHRDTKSRT